MALELCIVLFYYLSFLGLIERLIPFQIQCLHRNDTRTGPARALRAAKPMACHVFMESTRPYESNSRSKSFVSNRPYESNSSSKLWDRVSCHGRGPNENLTARGPGELPWKGTRYSNLTKTSSTCFSNLSLKARKHQLIVRKQR